MTKKTPHDEQPAGDFMEVGKEVVPGMRRRCICRGHTGPIGRIAWSPCERFIVSPSKDKTIRIWDAENGAEIRRISSPHYVYSAAWSPKQTLLATGAYDSSLTTWDAHTGQHVGSANLHGAVYGVSFSPNGEFLAAGTGENKLGLFDVSGAHPSKTQHLQVLKVISGGEFGGIADVTWSPSGDRLVFPVGSSLHLADVASGDTHNVSSPDAWHGVVGSVVWPRIGTEIRIGDSSGDIIALDPSTARIKTKLEGHTGRVTSISCSIDCRLLVSKSQDGTVRLWDTDTHEPVATVKERSCGNERWGECCIFTN